MAKNKITFVVVVFLLGIFGSAQLFAQKEIAGFSTAEIAGYKSKAKDQVKFLEYLLNTLGDESTSPRDKDAIILESYKKVFRDSKVQVEDDLTENRLVITNKDVTAYLKDIDFFFQKARFDFEIKEIEAFERDNGQLSLRVELLRTLKAVGLEGESILNTKKRYIETNLTEATGELQIVSIYTTKVSRDKALQEWWSTLSLGWKEIFKRKFNLTEDSLSLQQINQLVAVDSLNLSNENLISSVEPLSMLIDLKVLNLSNTQIQDLSPLSSLTNLKVLNLEATPIEELNYLRYAENIEELNIAFTSVKELTALQNLTKLRKLNLSGTDIREFSLLNDFKELTELNLSETGFSDLSKINDLPKLEKVNLSKTYISVLSAIASPNLRELDISFTVIADLAPLTSYQQLEVLSINNTQVKTLTSLGSLEKLEKVYADNILASNDELEQFKTNNPTVLIITNSEALSAWWASLPVNWKEAFKPYFKGNRPTTEPTKEQLTQLIGADSLNLQDLNLEQLFPLKKFSRLQKLIISGVSVNSLEPIKELNGLTYLDASSNTIQSVSPLLQLKKLTYLDISGNKLSAAEIRKLGFVNSLEMLNVNGMNVSKQDAQSFLQQNAQCVLRFDDALVKKWWLGLDSKWQQIMRIQSSFSLEPSEWELHKLIAMKSIVILDERIDDLSPFNTFIQLKSLFLERIDISNYTSLTELKTLEELTIKQMEFKNTDLLSPLNKLKKLTLDFSAVEDLRPLEALSGLEYLSVVGTKVDKLKGLEEMYELRYLDVSSTPVKKLKRIDELNNLELLLCFNTRIRERRVDNYQSLFPNCRIVWY